MSDEASRWKRCSSCKKDIDFVTPYWVCSVSTCNRKRTGMVFCSISCWEVHLPMMRHREAYAVEERSPSRQAWARELAQAAAEATASAGSAANPKPDADASGRSSSSGSSSSGSSSSGSSSSGSSGSSGEPVRRRTIAPLASSKADADSSDATVDQDDLPRDILIVVSKLKKYVRARSGMNTSDGVMTVLSDHLRAICNEAIRNAAKDGRKTVLDRDVPRPSASRYSDS